jgi:hypothetical protein
LYVDIAAIAGRANERGTHKAKALKSEARKSGRQNSAIVKSSKVNVSWKCGSSEELFSNIAVAAYCKALYYPRIFT